MNVQPITISEFRKNTKVILDQAKTRTIYISRGWEVFKLEGLGDATLSYTPELKEKLLSMPDKFDELKEKLDVRNTENPDWGA